jgi:hypothetical protein
MDTCTQCGKRILFFQRELKQGKLIFHKKCINKYIKRQLTTSTALSPEIEQDIEALERYQCKVSGAKYTVGSYIGNGAFSIFFKIRHSTTLGVKVRIKEEGDKAREILLKELKKADVLLRLGISVPRYVGVEKVFIPDYFDKTIEGKDMAKYLQDKLIGLKHQFVWGLILEVADNNLSMVSYKRVSYLYDREVEKIKSFGIEIVDSEVESIRWLHNVLWNQQRGKIYLIDFDQWKFPEKLLK